jgi:serpin B
MAAPARITALPRALSADDEQLIAASNRFGLRLFREVEHTTRDTFPNLFLSPLSVTMALGMLYTGAAGETEAAMGRTLEFAGLTPEEGNRSYRGLIQMLRALDPGVHFSLGNSFWCRQGINFTPSFLEASRTYFDARVEALDFSDPAAAGHINDWVRRATEGRIAEIVSSPIPSLAWMYLLNAIYFKGDWTAPFDPALTHSGRFRRADGSTTTVRMMSHGWPIGVRVTSDSNPLVVDLPYGGRAFSMTIALPREPGGISTLVAGLTAERWNAWMGALRPDRCEVRLPKFKLESELILNDALRALGMGIAFERGKADFGHMRPERDVHVTEVRHKSYVDVNEEGTEAAAATSVMLYGSSQSVRRVVVDRPFVFAIRDHLSGTILFLGRVLDPAAE